MNKQSIHYITLQCYNPGELLKEIPPYLNFENDIASEKWLYNQNAFIKIIDFGVILLGKNTFLRINALTDLN